MTAKKIYFASDFHLGAPDYESSLKREKLIVKWLDEMEPDIKELYILGDIFDFWYEYKHAVPKGYVRLLGKLASLADKKVPIHIFIGNHDLWMKDYLVKELNATIYREPIIKNIDGKNFYLAHGDGLGPGDKGFKIMKKIFTNRACQWLFSRIHPNAGIAMANFFSRRSRKLTGVRNSEFLGEDKEWLILHSKDFLTGQHIDYFVYGHRHYPMQLQLSIDSQYVNLGDWINYNSYAVWDGNELSLAYYKPDSVLSAEH